MFTNKIRLVTFDATNTLLNFCISPWEYYTKVASDHGCGMLVTEHALKLQFLENYKVLTKDYPNFGRDTIHWENWWKKIVHGTYNNQIKDSNIINNIANTLIEDYKTTKCWCLANGTMEILKYLMDSGVSLGVISNFDPRLHEILHNMSLDTFFKFVLTSYGEGYSKPDKRIFESAIRHSGINILPNECLHIGDDLKKDYEGAKAAGWQAILVTENRTFSAHVNSKYYFHNLMELYKQLKSEKLFI